MTKKKSMSIVLFALLLSMVCFFAEAQNRQGRQGRGGRGGMGRRSGDVKLLEQFDKDQNGWLNAEERQAARESQGASNQGGRRGGRRGGGNSSPVTPGPKLSPADVKTYKGVPLFDRGTLRTIFLTFENDGWEKEMVGFYHTDVELPATMLIDDKAYENVGVQFRGNSSFFSISDGHKRSLSIDLDHVHKKQDFKGYRGLTLLNSNSDPTFLHTVLYLEIARNYIKAPKANYMRVVINGESWGLYVNQERFNKDYLKKTYDTRKGIRFKSTNRSSGGGLSYLGDELSEYKRWYEIKSADKDESWAPLINVCKVLNETPPESLKAALEPIFDIDGALKFLALDIALMNGDGYWLYGGDYSILVDENNILRVLPYDLNETFSAGGGGRGGRGGRGGGGGGGGATAEPFANIDDTNKAMRNKLLVVPEFRTKYLGYLKDIAENWMAWEKIGPTIDEIHALIDPEVKADTRKLYSTEQFTNGIYGTGVGSIKGFLEQRRQYLLNHAEIKNLGGR